MKVIISVVMVIASVSFAVTATQTDWSGGGGVPGPVTDWGNSYDVADQVDDGVSPLCLASAPLAWAVEHSVDGSFHYAYSVYAADVDGDGDTDVLGAATSANEIAWWENTDGSGTLWTKYTVDDDFEGARSVYATDVDGDGDTDVLGAAYSVDNFTWWENTDGTGTVWTEHKLDGGFDDGGSVYATDIDGDGDTDVLGAASVGDKIGWWENIDGTGGVWAEHEVSGYFDGAESVYATDVDGDGDTDVLGAGYGADEIAWWENTDGTGGVWAEHEVSGYFDGANSVYATDVDGDGDMDVLGTACDGYDISWWENMNGSGTAWTEHKLDGDFNGACSVYATDVDGDGDTDVLGAAYGADDFTWWENIDSTGTVWTKHAIAGSFDGARSVHAADLDGDGVMDVLGASCYKNDITWWNVMGFSPTGSLESSIFDAGAVDSWENFTSSEVEPAGASVSYQFRSSNNSADMGAWSDTVFTNTSLSGILADSTDFLQYKVILQTTDPTSTPVLNDISFSYTTYVSVADDNAGEVLFWDLVPCTNPSFGNCAVQVSVPQPIMIDLVLHDITGRVVASYSQELLCGIHSISFNNLAEGVYFCTMHAGDFTATERVVVLMQ